MPIKPNLACARFPALTGFSLLEVQGRDAEAFLQSQLMNDVLALAPMHWHWSGWLSAKGRIKALFALMRLSVDRYWLVLPDFPATELLPELQVYVFRSKLTLRVVETWKATADSDGGQTRAPTTPDQMLGSDQDGYLLDFVAEGDSRRLLLLPTQHPACDPPSAQGDKRWRDADIAHGLPRLGPEQREAWTPQMLSLERLSAFSLKKGCYPGQEIVARTHYLGQAKRELVRLQGSRLEPGQDVGGPTAKIGSVICASTDGLQALAVLSSAVAGGQPLQTPLGPCERAPLLDGLARGRPAVAGFQ